MEPLKEIPYLLEQNENESWAIIENPQGKMYGSIPWYGERVVRSPFNSMDEARQRMKEISEHYEYHSIEVGVCEGNLTGTHHTDCPYEEEKATPSQA